MSKELMPPLLLFIVTIILSFTLTPFITGIGHDKQVFIYGAMTIWKGEMPYRNFFDHKPPVIYLLLSLAWPFKAWGFFFLGVVTKWIAAVFFYKAVKVVNLSNAWLYPVIFLICLLTPFILTGGLLTREYAACFLLILFSVIFIYPGRKYVISGFICGLVFHTQQEELILAFPFVIYHLLYRYDKNYKISGTVILERCLWMFAGFLILTVPLLIWLGVKGALFDYWNQNFIFNITEYTSRRPWTYKVRGIISILFHTRFLFLVVPLMAIHLFYIVRKINVSLHLACFSTIIFGLVTKTFAGRIIDNAAVYHYLLTLSPIISVSALILAKEIDKYLPLHYLKPVSIFFSVALFFVMWKNSFASFSQIRQSTTDNEIKELIEKFQDVKNKDGQLYVMGYTPFLVLNNNLNSLSPTKWIYTSQYTQHLSGFDAGGRVIKEIIVGLEKNKTKYVVDFHLLKPIDQHSFQQPWENYLEENYDELFRKKDYIVFRRRQHDKR